MKRIGNLIPVLALCLLLGGCEKTIDHKGKTPLVEVGRQFLYDEDLQAAMPTGIHGNDSIQFVERYIRNWVEDALLYQKAEGNILDNTKIEELVSSYRRALIVHKYQEALVEQEVGEGVEDVEIERYYLQNKDMFLADHPYVKGVFMKVPLNAPSLEQVRIWYKQNTQDAIDKLEKFCIGNAVSYDYFYNRWLPVSELSVKIPLKELDIDPDYLKDHKDIEVRDAAFCYLLHVEEFLPKRGQVPLEFAKSEIKEILINLKRVDFMKKVKHDLYQDALEDNDIIYY